MIEAFVAYGKLGDFVFGHHLGKLCGNEGGIDHFVFGVSRVDVAAVYGDAGTGGVEVFVFELAYFASVHGVRPIAAKFLDVKIVSAFTYLFVWIECYAYGTMFDFGVVYEVFYGGDYLSYTSFVIGSEECMSVGDDEVLAYVGCEFWVPVDFSDDVLLCIEDYIASLIVVYNLGVYVVSCEVGRGVKVGDEANGRDGGGCGGLIGWEGGIDIGLRVYLYVLEPEGAKLIYEVMSEGPLFLGAGAFFCLGFVGLGINAYVF